MMSTTQNALLSDAKSELVKILKGHCRVMHETDYGFDITLKDDVSTAKVTGKLLPPWVHPDPNLHGDDTDFELHIDEGRYRCTK